MRVLLNGRVVKLEKHDRLKICYIRNAVGSNPTSPTNFVLYNIFANRTQLDALDSQQSLIERLVQKILYKLHIKFCSNEDSRH